ncbi:MAG TPA: homoserine dehydrogenase, partial [Candidatus Deferrimicrobium sp.]|nr:homoserine dehydrogenase [Candidatus Deferrimicrobium sp.]
VMSGTPLLNLIRETLAGSAITEVKGILNGTTNYILTRMEEGLSYQDALKKAQELGYAEAVPDADVLGWDALAKVTILANAVFGFKCRPSDFPCEGITGITSEAITDAKRRGKRFKLIGRVWREGNRVKASVAPLEVELTHPLAGVAGATNALTITTDTLGDVTIVGPGAGRVPTGYSCLVDMIHAGGRR